MKNYILFLFFGITSIFQAQTPSKYIVVDQFGYRPVSEKIAVIRDPKVGFDANESFIPSNSYALVETSTNTKVFTGNLTQYKSGITDPSSGDKTWWFNFSSFQTPGTYYILDIEKNVKSYTFEIKENIYNEVLKHAVRVFFYQRAGYNKETKYANSNWTDSASHLGNLQDSQCRRWNAPDDATTERDLSGGWYDAGDYNKYTIWTANYIIDLLKAYKENPNAFGDDYNLPYSGNNMPDIIDEVKWGMDHLLHLQEADGSTISIVSLSDSSPPSSAKGQSLYGGVNTSSTLASSAAFAYGSKIFKELGYTTYANRLSDSAIKAWNWAVENPNVIWKNNDSSYNSTGIGAGQQEVDDYGRFTYKMKAATYLFDITKENIYKTFFEKNYENIHLLAWNFAYPFEQENQEILLYYSSLPNITESVATKINTTFSNAMNSINNFIALNDEKDPYLAHLADYTWGSNGVKSRKGLMFTDYVNYKINPSKNEDALKAAERYIHYIHGVNPLNFCYLSNMYDYGADNGVNEFYHAWFKDGTEWDNAKNDLYGPAPGFLVGGANPSYDWDSCCNSNCGSAESNGKCNATQVERIKNQPEQKAYDDFNTGWPMNSWSVTENSNGYQVAYIRLLSKFVTSDNTLSNNNYRNSSNLFKAYPSPFKNSVFVQSKEPFNYTIYGLNGNQISKGFCKDECEINTSSLQYGIYIIKISNSIKTEAFKIIKK